MLNDKGWDIVRIWSTDWFDNPSLQTTRLIEKLELLRHKPIIDGSEYTIVTEATQPADEAANVNEPAPDVPAAPDVPDGELPTQPITDAGVQENASLTDAECFEALSQFRSQVIANEMTDWEPHRSILRDAMIRDLVRQRFVEPDEWFDKVPGIFDRVPTPLRNLLP